MTSHTHDTVLCGLDANVDGIVGIENLKRMSVVNCCELNKNHVRKVGPRVYVRKRCLSPRKSILAYFRARS